MLRHAAKVTRLCFPELTQVVLRVVLSDGCRVTADLVLVDKDDLNPQILSTPIRSHYFLVVGLGSVLGTPSTALCACSRTQSSQASSSE
jgi:hypothetical protein